MPSRPSPTLTPNPRESQCLLPSIQVLNNGHPPVDSKRLPLGNEGHAQPTIAYLDPQSQGKPVPLPSIQVLDNGHPSVDSKRLPLGNEGHAQPTIAYLDPQSQGKPVPFTVDPGPRQRPPFGRFQEVTSMEAGSTGCRVGPLHRPTDHRRRPGPPPPAALDTASILIMTPGVVHAWMLRTAHAPRIAAFLRRLRLVITGETRVPGDAPGAGAAVMFRRIAAAMCSVGNLQAPRHQVATQLSVAQSAHGKRDGSALVGVDVTQNGGAAPTEILHLPPPTGDESPGSSAATMLTSSAGNGPHAQVILLCKTRRGAGRIESHAHRPGEIGPRRVAGCGDPGRSKPGGPTPAGDSRSPFVPVPDPPIRCLLHDEQQGGEGHAGSTANRITFLGFTTTPATGPGTPGRPSRPRRRGRTGPGKTLRPGRGWPPGLLRGNASLNRLQRGRHRAGRRDNRPDRGFSAARTAFTRSGPANVHGPMFLGKRPGPTALVLASSNGKSHTTGMMRTCSRCGRAYQPQRRRGPGCCSSRCRTAAHREGRRQSAEQQVMAITSSLQSGVDRGPPVRLPW